MCLCCLVRLDGDCSWIVASPRRIASAHGEATLEEKSLLILNLENGERWPVQAPPGVAPVVLEANAVQALNGGNKSVNGSETKLTILEARVGVEPTNGGFADLSLRPLGYRAETMKYSETGLDLSGGARSWESLLTSYPPGEAEVYESEAGVGIGFAFEVGARGPAEGGGAGPRAPRKIRSP